MDEKFEKFAPLSSFSMDEQFAPSSSSSSKLAQLLSLEKSSPSMSHTTLSPSRPKEVVEHHDDLPVIIGSYNPYANQNSIPKSTMSQHMLFDKPRAAQVPMHNTIESVSDYELDSGSDFDSLSLDDDDQLPFSFQ